MGYCATCDHNAGICGYHHLAWLLRKLNDHGVTDYGTAEKKHEPFGHPYWVLTIDGEEITSSDWSPADARLHTHKIIDDLTD